MFLFPNSNQNLGDVQTVYGGAEQDQPRIRGAAAVTGKQVFQGLGAVVGYVDCSLEAGAAQRIDDQEFVVRILFDEQQAWGVEIQKSQNLTIVSLGGQVLQEFFQETAEWR